MKGLSLPLYEISFFQNYEEDEGTNKPIINDWKRSVFMHFSPFLLSFVPYFESNLLVMRNFIFIKANKGLLVLSKSGVTFGWRPMFETYFSRPKKFADRNQ